MARGSRGSPRSSFSPSQGSRHLGAARRLGRLLARVRLRHGEELRVLAPLRYLHGDLPPASSRRNVERFSASTSLPTYTASGTAFLSA